MMSEEKLENIPAGLVQYIRLYAILMIAMDLWEVGVETYAGWVLDTIIGTFVPLALSVTLYFYRNRALAVLAFVLSLYFYASVFYMKMHPDLLTQVSKGSITNSTIVCLGYAFCAYKVMRLNFKFYKATH